MKQWFSSFWCFQFYHFKKMLREAGKKSLQPLKVTKGDLKPLLPQYEKALTQLAEILEVYSSSC